MAAGDVGQREVAGFAVERVGQRSAVAVIGLATLEVDHAFGLAPGVVELFLAVGNGESGLAGLGVEVSFVGGEGRGLEKIAAGKEVEVRLHQVATDLGVHLAVLLVGVEASGGGVVHAHAGGDAHCGAGVFGPHGNRGDGGDAVGQYADGVVVGLATCGQSRAAGGRIGDAVAVALRVDEGYVGETREGEGLDAATTLDGGQIGLGGVHLVHAHAVADEVKHVLRPLLGEGHGGKGQTEAESEEFAFHLVWMDCGWMNVSWGKVTFFLAHALLCVASICVWREQTVASRRLFFAFFRGAHSGLARWGRKRGDRWKTEREWAAQQPMWGCFVRG